MASLKLCVCSTECRLWPEANLVLCLKKRKGRDSNILVADHMNTVKYSHDSEFVGKPICICSVYKSINFKYIYISVYIYTLTCFYSCIQKCMVHGNMHGKIH